jgi:hypothetical protein
MTNLAKECRMTPKSLAIRPFLNLILALAVALLLIGASCQTTKPASDSTPPAISWDVYDFAANTHATYGGAGGTVSSSTGQSFRVTCKAKDSGGISQITLGGGGSYGCSQGDVGSIKHMDQITDVQNLSPNASNQVLTEIFLMRNVDPDTWTCQSGHSFTGGSLTLHCTATNYYAGTVSSSLTISR